MIGRRRTPSPRIERNTDQNLSLNEHSVSHLEGLDLNPVLTKDDIYDLNMSQTGPKQSKKHSFVNKLKRLAGKFAENEELSRVSLRRVKGERCSTASNVMISNRKRYHLPLSYQVMNEKHKEGTTPVVLTSGPK